MECCIESSFTCEVNNYELIVQFYMFKNIHLEV